MDDDITVRVAVRIRPQLPRELIDMCKVCTYVIPGTPQVTLSNEKSFSYDYVFDTDTPQDAVYNSCVSALVDSSLEGYNATVLAYGQTGSGKTYTMGSGFDVELPTEQLGIIPRAIHHLFDGIRYRIKQAQENGLIPPEFKVTAQFMELYNEEVIDLFNPASSKDKVYKIREDSFGGIQVKGITHKTVTSAEEALQYLRVGALSRTTGSTQMNTQSSRSHAIFTLQIKQQRIVPSNDTTDANEFETLTAKFHFVDLAGSERLKRTGATGERAKEGICINCGLLALGNVISALGDRSRRASHIPYRDSKLTRLLQDSLGGNSKTVMIACVSPSDSDFMETLNTLKYANRARNIKNKIVVNQDKSSKTIAQLKQQIAQLQLELVEYKQGKRMISQDGSEVVNDMFYENNMLQEEINYLRSRVKALQETIDSLTKKNTNLLTEKAAGAWIGGDSDNDVASLVQTYLQEIEELSVKLIESNNTCEQLRKQINRLNSSHNSSFVDFDDNPLLEEARRSLEKEKEVLKRCKLENDSDESDNDVESESDEKDIREEELKDELINLNNDIGLKQKLIEELERSQKRMQVMRQHYEDKLMQLQTRIKNTQEERDKVLHSYSIHPEPSDKIKKIKDEYTKKLSDMQKELKKLQAAQKEHARLLRDQSQRENTLKSYKNELLEMKRTKVRLINKMKEESQKHKESELRRIREIAQLKKETRKNANVIKSMEAEKKLKDQVLKRKQEEMSLLRKRARGHFRHSTFSERAAKEKWLKAEKLINNITLSKKDLLEEEVRMQIYLKRREALADHLADTEEKRTQAFKKRQDVGYYDSLIDDINEEIKFVQETIAETQQNIVGIEETQDTSENGDLLTILDNLSDVEEAKYMLQKLFNMTLSQSNAVLQRDARIKETETRLAELEKENQVKSQLLDHCLNTDIQIQSTDIQTSISSNASGSNTSSRSPSPCPSESMVTSENGKIRRRTALPSELLFGVKAPEPLPRKNVMAVPFHYSS